MKLPIALHTAARRYCHDRFSFWCDKYSEIVQRRGDRQGDGYTAEALATFPRYNLLNAIRVELERIDPEKLDDLDSTRSLLILAGEVAEDESTRPPNGEIETGVMAEEREAFCQYVRKLKPIELDAIENLPYRRALAKEESKSIWEQVRTRWQIQEGYWYPLSDCNLPDIQAFDTEAFDMAVPRETLLKILMARGIGRVFELREYGPEYEEDLALFEPSYNGAEGYWTSNGLEWIIYASHESSITVGGWMLNELKTLWPTWEAHVWA